MPFWTPLSTLEFLLLLRIFFLNAREMRDVVLLGATRVLLSFFYHPTRRESMKRLLSLFFCTIVLFLFSSAAHAQTGKIAGTVTDESTGEALPGVNVVLEGTTQGATTDADGFYTIINVRPGTYDVRASFIGFTPVVRQGVQVNIDLTAEVNFELQEEAVGLEEVVVSAEQGVVKRDLSASRVDITAEQIENLPVTDVNRVVKSPPGSSTSLTL